MRNFYSTICRKHLVALLAFLSTTFACVLGQPIPDRLHYRFDETGTTVTNYASNPPVGTATATIMGGVTQGGTGLCNTALVGTGNSSSSDYLNTGWNTNLSGSWTISFWSSNFDPSGILFYVFGDLDAGQIRCFTNGVAGANNWILRGTGMADVLVNGGATTAPHVTTFVYDQSVNTIYGYLDGVLVNTVAQPGALVFSSSSPFKVMGYSTNVGAPLGGQMDDFRMYSYALSAAEVAELVDPSLLLPMNVTACDSYTVPSGNMTYTTSGIYYDTIVAPGLCDTIYEIDLTINIPMITANALQDSVCEGDSLLLYGEGGSGYAWDNGVLDSVEFEALSSASYIVTGLDGNGCVGADTIDIVVFASPVIGVTADPSTSICEGDDLTLSGSGADSYVWTGGIDDGVAFVPTASETFTVTGTDSNGCSATLDVPVSVNVATTSTLDVSAVDSITINGQTYNQNGTYTQVIPNAAGCDSTITINLVMSSVGLSELSETFSVYPNPTSDNITVKTSNAQDQELLIIDVHGREVVRQHWTGTTTQVDLSSLEAGTYTLQLMNHPKPVRFVKQ